MLRSEINIGLIFNIFSPLGGGFPRNAGYAVQRFYPVSDITLYYICYNAMS